MTKRNASATRQRWNVWRETQGNFEFLGTAFGIGPSVILGFKVQSRLPSLPSSARPPQREVSL